MCIVCFIRDVESGVHPQEAISRYPEILDDLGLDTGEGEFEDFGAPFGMENAFDDSDQPPVTGAAVDQGGMTYVNFF